jgi:hypothetical protein
MTPTACFACFLARLHVPKLKELSASDEGKAFVAAPFASWNSVGGTYTVDVPQIPDWKLVKLSTVWTALL